MILATTNRNSAIVQILLKNGAATEVKNAKGYTALLIASNAGLKDVVKALLTYGADVNAKLANGYAAIHLAAMNNHKGCVTELVSNGADVNARGQADITPLMGCCFFRAP